MNEPPYTCLNAEKDMDFFFQNFQQPVGGTEQNAALFRALNHMTAGSTLEHHNIACQQCWDRYMELKRTHEGG
jgi:hypothetical protein